MKQSSVEWLEKAFYTHARSSGIDNDKWVITEETLDKLLEQAKAMHKQEHEDAYIEGGNCISNGWAWSIEGRKDMAGIHYNETFGE